jgi:branched-chain amino acid aminotransferase
MVNFNGNIQENSFFKLEENRGFLFGDAVFDTIRVIQNKVVFLEDHYLRLMASMRICRMEIPMNFTMEYFQENILQLTNTLQLQNARVRITFFRNSDGFYTPTTNNTNFIITAILLENNQYNVEEKIYEVELYKDFYISNQLLSTIKTNNKMVHVLAGVFAKENNYQNCLLLNEQKNVVEAINGNIFMRNGYQIITPPITDGCLQGIIRKKIIEIIGKQENYILEEKSISPFDLQKADELFVTNSISGVLSVTKYRKKEFVNDFAKYTIAELNKLVG